jgi:hypothetical protein
MGKDMFWMVLGRGMPTVRHPNRHDAEAEAARLALQIPGQEFVVLQAVATHCAVISTRTSLDGYDECGDIPF